MEAQYPELFIKGPNLGVISTNLCKKGAISSELAKN